MSQCITTPIVQEKKNAIKPEPLGRMTDSGRPFSSPKGEKRFVTGNDFLHFPLIDD
jgi:hypothetical protein